MNKRSCWNRVVTSCLLLGLLLNGCNAIPPTTALAPTLVLTPTVPGVELLFETVERAEISGTGDDYPGKTPNLMVITRAEDVIALGNTVSPSAQDELSKLDYNIYFVLVVFQGIKGTNMYGVDIQRVTRDENRITVFAHFTERDPEMAAADVITSPYHIVKVPRDGLKGEFEFFLNGDGEVILKVTATL